MDFFPILSLIDNIEIRFPHSITLLKEFFSLRDIMDRMLGDPHSSDNLKRSIHGDRGFQESFSRLTVPHE